MWSTNFFYVISISESVSSDNEWSNHHNILRILITYRLVVISCKNSNFQMNQSNFCVKRSRLALFIWHRDIWVHAKKWPLEQQKWVKWKKFFPIYLSRYIISNLVWYRLFWMRIIFWEHFGNITVNLVKCFSTFYCQ